jgi:hypothetical protein
MQSAISNQQSAISNQQLLKIDETGIQSLIHPYDLELYKENIPFYFVKLVSTIGACLLVEYTQNENIIKPLVGVNILEAVITGLKKDKYNSLYGLFVLAMLINFDMNKTSNFYIFLTNYIIWNVRFCKYDSDLKLGLVHNMIPMLISLVSTNKFRSWTYSRGVSISTVVLAKYIEYLRTEEMLKK